MEATTKMASNATHYNNLTPAKPLDKATLNKMVFRSLNLQASFNYERMQAAGWLYCILPGLEKIHADNKEDLELSMEHNLEFFNTHPFLVTFVMGIASAVCFGVNKLLIALDLGYMQTVAFILVIAGLVQFIEMFLKKAMPSLYTALGVYLPLITTNCAVLGVVLLNVQNDYTFIASVVYGITGGLGFLLAIYLFSTIRERVQFADYPKCFEGFPIALITAGLIALAFMGFSGLQVWPM